MEKRLLPGLAAMSADPLPTEEAKSNPLRCACGQGLSEDDRYCRSCGAQLGADRFFDQLWVILILLFLIIGPLALPMVWRSKKLNPAVKALLTLLSVAEFFAITWGMQRAYMYSIEQVRAQIDFGR